MSKRFDICPQCKQGGVIDLSVLEVCLLCATHMPPVLMGKLFKHRRKGV